MTRKAAKKATKSTGAGRAARGAAARPNGARPAPTPKVRSFTEERLDAICEALCAGVPLAEVCRRPGMPCRDSVYSWEQDPVIGKRVRERIERARDFGYDAIAADALRIADTPQEGVSDHLKQVEIDDPDGEGGKRTELQVVERRVEDMTGHRKLQVWTRLQLLAKWSPRYRENVNLNHGVQDNLADQLRAARERARNR